MELIKFLFYYCRTQIYYIMTLLLKSMLLLLSAGVFSISCKGDDTIVEQPKTIYALASADADLFNLKAALDRAGLSPTLNQTGEFTVFAPSNAAFNSLLAELGLANLGAVSQATLENALKYHVVAGANVASTDITNNLNLITL
ncbi:putative surface protein with fasciclin (FAS1) repeats [Chryseobacterium sp. MP_3.2]|nr:putative surface protein with fasciclin (FAS1) repeats [Chryseobacterium sp. MP_3.2]